MSETYEQFAGLYDQLMEDAPYDAWVELIEQCFRDRKPEDIHLLELGAGTGTLAYLLMQKAYVMTVSDFSEDMLSMAEQKLRPLDSQVTLALLDMRTFDLDTVFDGVLILCDALNYLANEDEVLSTFEHAYHHIKPGGLLVFDVHSTFKIKQFIKQQTFGSSDLEISYLWECYPHDVPNGVVHELTFFVKTESGDYKRIEETHEQRTYPISVYLNALQKAGFEEPEILGDFDPKAELESSERWLFIARRP